MKKNIIFLTWFILGGVALYGTPSGLSYMQIAIKGAINGLWLMLTYDLFKK